MKLSWTFDIGTYRWSTQDITVGGTSYSAKIIPGSFSGVQMRWNIGNRSLISPSDIDFKIENTDGTISRANLEGQTCLVSYVIDGVVSRQFKFKIQRATSAYKLIQVYCVDILQAVLFGEYPNTPHPREQWVSANHEPEDGEYDNYRIPVIFGEAYIPLMYIYRASNNTGYYVLGKDQSYTIVEVKSPAEIAKLVWDNTYTFTQTSDGGYRLVQFYIVPTETEGSYDAGTWRSHLKPLVRYSKSSGSTTNPATIMANILQEFGVSSADIDSSGSWSSAATKYTTQGIVWNGGIYESTEKESLIRDMLAQCDSLFYISDKIELHPFSKTPVETITISKTIRQSFRASRMTFNYNDSGHLAWAEDGYPQNKLVGKAIIPSKSGGTKNSPTKETFNCKYINDSIPAQKLGILYFQRKLTGQDDLSFETTADALTTIDTIMPGNVITINDPMFGESRDMIVSSLHLKTDGKVGISGNTFEQIDDFDSITVSPISVPEDGTIYMSDNLLILKADSLIFKFDAEGTPTPVDQVINFEAVSLQETDEDFEFTTTPYVKSQTSASNEFTLTVAEFGDNDSMVVTVTQGYAVAHATVFRVSDGEGSNGRTVTLTSTAQLFLYDEDGLNPDPVGAIVTATAFGLDTTKVIEYDFYLNNTLVSTSTTNLYSYTPQPDRLDMPDIIEVRVREDADVVAIDQMFMAGLKDGERGLDAGNWNSTIIFSSSAYNVVNWSSGQLYSPGIVYSIFAGTTGAMAPNTVYFIYFTPEIPDELQVSTDPVDVVGAGQVMVCVARTNMEPGATQATFQAFGGVGGILIAGDHIVGNTITGNHFVANLITTSKISAPAGDSTGETKALYLGGATGGVFVLSDGVTNTPELPYNTSAATIQSELGIIYGTGLVKVTASTDFSIAFDITVEESGLTADFTGLVGALDPLLVDAINYNSGLPSLVIDFSESEITVNNPDGIIIDAEGGIKVTENSSIIFSDSADVGSGEWIMSPSYYNHDELGLVHELQLAPVSTGGVAFLSLGSTFDEETETRLHPSINPVNTTLPYGDLVDALYMKYFYPFDENYATNPGHIAGRDYWIDQLETGALLPEDIEEAFYEAVKRDWIIHYGVTWPGFARGGAIEEVRVYSSMATRIFAGDVSLNFDGMSEPTSFYPSELPGEDPPTLGTDLQPWGELHASIQENHMWSGDTNGQSVALPTDATQIFKMTMGEYEALSTKNPHTLYLITE